MSNIKLVIFDLDGVLVDSRDLHYDSLNKALQEINQSPISREEHLSTFDGLSTAKKLNLLSEKKGLPSSQHQKIWKLKQQFTLDIINGFNTDERIRDILKQLKYDGKQICCCTNSIRETAKLQLARKGFLEYIDYLFTNEDVNQIKPSAEIYLRAMLACKVDPDETLIIEDSHIGRKAATRSGAHLLPVKNSLDLSYERINRFITKKESYMTTPKWQGSEDVRVLIPMAGAGSRFEKAGYTFPKPLIDVQGKPMIQVVIENLNIDAEHIFIVQKEHYIKYNLQNLLNIISPGCKIVQVESMTEGAACTTLLAKEYFNDDEGLIIANSDQFIDWDSSEFMYSMIADSIDAGILTFNSTHPKWSYARVDDNGFVVEVAEKNPISNLATAGIYYWKKGSDYVKYAEQMIDKNIRVNNEFYVCPVFNQAVEDNKKIKTFNIEKMWGLGTPEDLDYYLKHHTEYK
jgi:HAD superfamily hydrolase (TIGR01509 family)